MLGWKLTRTYEAARDRSGAIPGRVEVNGRILYRRHMVEAWLAGSELAPVAPVADPPVTFPDTGDARRAGRASGGG